MGFSLGLFNSKHELTDFFKNSNLNIVSFYFKEASLEEEEESYLYLYKKIKEDNNFIIFISGTVLLEKLEYLIKQTKNKNISIIYSVNAIHKGLIKETDIKVYKNSISPAIIDFLARRSGIDYYKIKNLNENECIVEEGETFKIIEFNNLNKKIKYLK